uniref:Uncharacterized protein n=1 Tax=Caulobacter sp. (strain K31) TaxID=366602 RepID=B0T0A3_CAUSK
MLIAILLTSSLITVIAVIGLADAVTHLLCWTARSLRDPDARRAVSPSSDMARLTT